MATEASRELRRRGWSISLAGYPPSEYRNGDLHGSSDSPSLAASNKVYQHIIIISMYQQ